MTRFLLLFFAFLSLTSTIVRAEDLPKISAPAYTQESYSLKLSQAEIENLKAWAKEIKSDLNNAINNSLELKSEEKLAYLKSEIESITNLYKDQSNIFVRYSLNRSLKLIQIIEEEDQSAENSILDVKVRLLTQSLKIAQEYAEFDFTRFKEFNLTTYSRFGLDYFALTSELAKSIFDASAQYEMYKISLEYLQWDLYRELDNTHYASTIIKINNFLKKQPKAFATNQEIIEEIRKMKNIITQLEIRQYQGAVESNVIARLIKDVVDKNKNVNILREYEKNEKIIIWEPFNPASALKGKSAVFVEMHEYKDAQGIQTLYTTYKIFEPTTKKKYDVQKNDIFRTSGCLPNTELCVGVTAVNSRDKKAVNIIAISKYGYVLVQSKNGQIDHVNPIELYRRSGCSKKINVCVGDKLVDYSSKLRYVTAVSDESPSGLLFTGESIYDEQFVLDSTFSKGKL